jgi:hypothetical protein
MGDVVYVTWDADGAPVFYSRAMRQAAEYGMTLPPGWIVTSERAEELLSRFGLEA